MLEPTNYYNLPASDYSHCIVFWLRNTKNVIAPSSGYSTFPPTCLFSWLTWNEKKLLQKRRTRNPLVKIFTTYRVCTCSSNNSWGGAQFIRPARVGPRESKIKSAKNVIRLRRASSLIPRREKNINRAFLTSREDLQCMIQYKLAFAASFEDLGILFLAKHFPCEK